MERHQYAVSTHCLASYTGTRRVVCLPSSGVDAGPAAMSIACIRLSMDKDREGRLVAGARVLVACDS